MLIFSSDIKCKIESAMFMGTWIVAVLYRDSIDLTSCNLESEF